MLTVSSKPGKFTVQQKADSDTYRYFQCITNYKGETCFVIGGERSMIELLRSVSRYNVAKDQWE